MAATVARPRLPAPNPPPPDALRVFRDDGPLAILLGAALGRALALPAAVLVAAGMLPAAVAMLVGGGDTPHGVAAAAIGWYVALAGASAGRPQGGRERWLVAPLMRAAEYIGVLWIVALQDDAAYAAPFALLCALALRHYDLVYRLRHRNETPPVWVNRLTLGWEGRLIGAVVLLLAGALPAGMFVAAAVLGVVVAAETTIGWVRFARSSRGQAQVYEEEEDEGQ